MNKEKPTAWCEKKYLFHFLTCSCMCHCVVPKNIIKKPTIRVTWKVTQIARGSRVLKDQNKSESGFKREKKKENKNNIITQNNNKNSR